MQSIRCVAEPSQSLTMQSTDAAEQEIPCTIQEEEEEAPVMEEGEEEKTKASQATEEKMTTHEEDEQEEEPCEGPNGNNGSKIASVDDAIAKRLKDKVFPAVHPQETQDEGASQTLQLTEQIEVVQLQIFLDAKRSEYLSSVPPDSDVSPQARNFRWARDEYYRECFL